MDQPSRSSEPRERAVSSEPCSTRPNPFDDDELSARKRRRTSLSGGASPTRSTGTGTAGSSYAPGADPPEARPSSEDSTMKVDADPAGPQTPESDAHGPDASAEPRSSRVTINLRNTHRPLDTIPSSPLSSTSPAAAAQAPEAQADDVKISVEDSEVEMSQPGTATSTPISSAVDGGSPPIEVVDSQQDDDGEPDFGPHEPRVTLIQMLEEDNAGFVIASADDENAVLVDPTPRFPYRIKGEHQQESLGRVNQSILGFNDVAFNLVRWMRAYIQYAKDAEYPALLDSVQQYRCLWLGLPEIVTNVYFRRNTVRDRELRSRLFNMFREFSTLAAHFARLDLEVLRSAVEMGDSRPPELISPYYLLALNTVCRLDDMTMSYSNGHNMHQDEVSELIECFLSHHQGQERGGSFGCLWRLAEGLVKLLPRFPRLSDNLHYICQLSALVLYHDTIPAPSNSILHTDEKVRNRQNMAYELFKVVAVALSTLIEKGITHLSPEHTGGIIKWLGDVLRYSLRGIDNPGAVEHVEDFRKANPQIFPGYIPEVVSTQWRFNMFSRLIMSSQMQLRVMAVTEMCSDMVNCWKRFSEPQNEPRNAAVQHFFADSLLGSDLVSYLLGPTCHPEITAESYNIIGFLLVTNTYSNEHTDLLWQTVTTTQDPRVAEALLRMVGRIAQLFQLDGVLYLLHKLESLPVEHFSPAVREFADTMLKHAMARSAQSDRSLDRAPYFLCLRLMRESSVMGPKSPVAYPEVRDFANAKFKELLSSRSSPDAEAKASLYEDCMRDIANKSQTTPGSLSAVYHLVNLFLARELSMLTAQYSFAELLVNELEHAILVGRKNGYHPVISGQPNAHRLELIYSLVNHQPMAILANDLGRRLWDMMVGKTAACQEDRDASWKILHRCLRRMKPENPFVTTCLTEYLPLLPPECFCTGTLELIRAGIMPVINDPKSDVLDDEEDADWGAIEQIWRVILTTTNAVLEQQAIETLVSDIYLNSKSIRNFSHHRARKVHLGFVDRCLKQLFSAAAQLKSAMGGTPSGDDKPMDVAPSETEIQQQSLLFVRSLAVLREFHRVYSRLGHFATPDLRSLSLALPNGIEGDSAELKFQCFDGDMHTDVKELNIGRRNTAASLLASLKEATGFENYRIYYRGQPFVPQEADICRPLEDLHIHNGLILVKRETAPVPTSRVRPGASPVEVEILSHFDKLWECLSMEVAFAQEIYQFLVRLPADERMLDVVGDDSKSPTEIFPVGQAFKSLYAVFAMRELLRTRRRAVESSQGPNKQTSMQSYEDALRRVLWLLVAAIRSREVIESCPTASLQIFLTTMILDTLVNTLNDARTFNGQPMLPLAATTHLSEADSEAKQCLDGALVRRLVELLVGTMAAQSSNDNAGKLATLLFQAILDCAVTSRVCWDALEEAAEMPAVVERLVLRDPRPAVRGQVRDLILAKFRERDSYLAVSSTELERFFWPLVCRLIPPAIGLRYQCEDSFVLWLDMFKSMKASRSVILDMQTLLDVTCDIMLSYEPDEDITQPEMIDVVAHNLAQMLRSILQSEDGSGEHGLVAKEDVAHKLFWKHLFPDWRTDTNRPLPRLFVHSQTRRCLIEAMLSSIGNDTEQLEKLLTNLDRLVPVEVGEGDDLYHYELPFAFDRSKAIRSSCGYAGLRNLSNTCYLNSLFTQLFMNVGFRQFILSADVPDRDYSQKLLFNTQIVFGFLQNSLRRFTDPQACVANIKTYDDTAIDIHNQMDVDEFYNLLFDRWEGQLLSSESKKAFRSFYGGQLVQQVRSKECEHISEILEPFSAIQCDIKGKSSLQESLQAYVDGEIMGGDNKYKCSTCDRHVDAVKRACLKDIPDNLIFHLKRFDFNLRSLTRNKINDYFGFPTRIDMRPYTIEHLSNPGEETPPDMFELVGVLVHSGTAESGHYYSYVRERPTSSPGETWIEFNDDLVSRWDPSHMEASCFGGPDLRTPYDGAGQPYDKTYSAYMLFYQRSSALAEEQEALARTSLSSPLRVSLPADLHAHIQDENMVLLRRHCLFDPSHLFLVCTALEAYQQVTVGDGDAHARGRHKVAVHMTLGHLDQVASRQKDTPDFDRVMASTLMWLAHCKSCAIEMLRYFSERPAAFRMLLQRNPDSNVRSRSAELILTIMRETKMHFTSLYVGLPAPDCLVLDALKLMDELWRNFHVNIRSWPEVFSFMHGFVLLGPQEMGLFLDRGHLEDLIQVISAEPGDPENQFARMANTIQRRLPNRPPNYDNIIALIAVLLEHMQLPRGNERADTEQPRFHAACQDPEAPFEMTKREISLIGKDWLRGQGNVFVEKLLTLNQNAQATESIVESLISLSPTTEHKVLMTLTVNINGAMVSHHNLPFLRAAVIFCRTSRNVAFMKELFMHICQQCRTLNNAEGRAFFEFHQNVFEQLSLSVRHTPARFPEDGLKHVHRWAPYLLAYYEPQVGSDVFDFLYTEIFHYGPGHGFPEEDGGIRRTEALDSAARRLAMESLKLLKTNFVTRGNQIQKQIVANFEQLLDECDKYFDDDQASMGHLLEGMGQEEYQGLKREVLEPLQKLTVEDLEDDASEWENSCASSEQMDSLGDFSIQAAGDLVDGDLQ